MHVNTWLTLSCVCQAAGCSALTHSFPDNSMLCTAGPCFSQVNNKPYFSADTSSPDYNATAVNYNYVSVNGSTLHIAPGHRVLQPSTSAELATMQGTPSICTEVQLIMIAAELNAKADSDIYNAGANVHRFPVTYGTDSTLQTVSCMHVSLALGLLFQLDVCIEQCLRMTGCASGAIASFVLQIWFEQATTDVNGTIMGYGANDGKPKKVGLMKSVVLFSIDETAGLLSSLPGSSKSVSDYLKGECAHVQPSYLTALHNALSPRW